jgi:hypothetical protein
LSLLPLLATQNPALSGLNHAFLGIRFHLTSRAGSSKTDVLSKACYNVARGIRQKF